MRKQITFLLVVLISISALSQYAITIDASVIDVDSKDPIPYVNVGFIDKAVGTVSNEEGLVSIEFDESRIGKDDVIQFSMVGYQTESYTFEQLINKFQKTNTVELKKEIFGLDEIVLASKWGDKIQLGSKTKTDKLLAYWKGKTALGGEIAGFIKIPKGKFKLSELAFNLVENISDSVKIRVNVYDYKRGYPGDKYLTKPIYHTITSKSGIEKINLSPANLIVSDDVVISIELLEVYGDALELSISQSLSSKRSFSRYISQDRWSRQTTNGVDLSVIARRKISSESDTDTNKNIESVSILWDVSKSMEDRDIEKEKGLLTSYFSDVTPQIVEVYLFSNVVNEKRSFQFPQQQSALFSFLEGQGYYGNTDASELLVTPHTADITFLFSDGNFNLGSAEAIYTTGECVIVSSTSSSNSQLLNKWAQENEGTYLPLDEMKRRTIKSQIEDNFSSNSTTVQIKEMLKGNTVQGAVYLFDKPIRGVVIGVAGSLKEVTTDENGRFTIDVNKNDVLNFGYLNTIPQSVTVANFDTLSINLEPTYDMLEEVKLKGNSKRNKIPKGFKTRESRAEEMRASAQAMTVLEKEDFPAGPNSFADIMRRMPLVNVKGNGASAEFFVRNTPITAIVVDEVLFSGDINSIDLNNIASVVVIRSVIGAPRYGVPGPVIIITTRMAEITEELKRADTLLAKGNDYKEELQGLSKDLVVNDFETLLLELTKRKKLSEAENAVSNVEGIAYKDLTNKLSIDDFDMLRDRFLQKIATEPLEVNNYIAYYRVVASVDQDEAKRGLFTILELANDNVRVLRSLAFFLEEQKMYKEASTIHARILLKSPQESQSYLDLAQSYKKAGKYKESFEQLKTILTADSSKFEVSEQLIRIAETEVKHLLTKYKDRVNYTEVPQALYETVHIIDKRILIEWNDPQMEFDLQFVNPAKKFYNWSQTFNAEDNSLDGAVKNGLLSKEFIIDDDKTTGEWIINVTNNTFSESKIPSFIKMTVQSNYGNPDESEQVLVIPISQLDQKYTVNRIVM